MIEQTVAPRLPWPRVTTLLHVARGARSEHHAAERTMRRITGTFATKIMAMSLGVPMSLILARALGPDGRGEFVAATAIAALGMQFGNLGLHSANTYFVSRDRSLLGPLALNSVVVASVLGVLIGVLLCLARLSGFFLQNVNVTYLLLAIVWIPLGIGQLLQQNLIVGIQRFAVFNNVDVGIRGGNLVLGLALWSIGIVTPVPYLLAVIAVLAVSYAFCFGYLRRQVDGPMRPALGVLRDQLPYGAKTFLASLFAFLVVRSDVLVLMAIRGSRETGVYSVGVSLVDMLYLAPTAVGVVLFPELSAATDPEARWRVLRSAMVHTAWIMGLGATVIMVWGAPIISLLFGRAYAGAYPVVVVLAPAMVAYGLNNIVAVYLAAEGLPWFGVWVWVLAFALNLGLNLVWIPGHGGVGAAWASLVAYGAVFGLQFTYVLKHKVSVGAKPAPGGAS